MLEVMEAIFATLFFMGGLAAIMLFVALVMGANK